jgi:putative hydrolase of the HAD superfamily
MLQIRAISLDLDDTLWPIEPVIVRAEQRLDDWLQRNCPAAAAQFPIHAMRALRERISVEHPHLSHDFTAQRMLSLRAALAPHGYGDTHVDQAFAEYYAARNEVECYADVIPALERLSARFPLVSISNGNADLERIGLARYFQFSVSSRAAGVAKPSAQIFHAACARLGVTPDQVMHVGDDPELDVAGARAAGMRSVWINRTQARWPQLPAADLTVRSLHELADAFDALAVNRTPVSALA